MRAFWLLLVCSGDGEVNAYGLADDLRPLRCVVVYTPTHLCTHMHMHSLQGY
jgi:hypothetical protein